jgi:hypothetical protein
MTTKLLRITTVTDKTTSNAVAILTNDKGAWTVGHTAPSLAWMRGLEMAAIKQRLEATGAKWEWMEVSAQFAQVAQGHMIRLVRQAHQPAHQPTPQRTQKAAKATPAANVTKGEQAWFNGVQNAIKAEKRKAAIVRNVWNKRKEAPDHA